MLRKIRDKFVEGIYLSTLSVGVINSFMISFVLVTSNLRYIQEVIHWNAVVITFVFSPLIFFGVILTGFVLDKFVNYAKIYATEANKRNPQISEILERVRSIDNKLDKYGKGNNR